MNKKEKFKILLTETYEKVFEIESNDEKEALMLIEQMYDDGSIDTTSCSKFNANFETINDSLKEKYDQYLEKV